MIGIIYVKRRQRLPFQQAGRIKIDGPPGPVADAQPTEEVPGALVPFTLSDPISQLRTTRAKSLTITVPPAQIPVLNEQRSTRIRDGSEGRELAETVQRLQERITCLEGRSSGGWTRDRRLQRTSTPSLSQESLPTYQS
jgi:hypothetical protein